MNAEQDLPIVVDARMTREQCVTARNFPAAIVDSQVVVSIHYTGFDARRHEGQIVINRLLADDIREIFHEIDSAHFPIQSVIPIVHFGWSDDSSIAANNTSAFNYRTVPGTSRLSMHAYGRAIDVNPYLNPWMGRKGQSSRPYNLRTPGTIGRDDMVVNAFRKRGWTWGGDWQHSKDYQHFEKRTSPGG